MFRISTPHEFACMCDVWAEDARGKMAATSNTALALYGKRHIACPKNKHEADFRCDSYSKSKEVGSQKHVSQKLSLDLMI